MNINLYNLQPKQQEFANMFCKFRLFGGAKGWWKSYTMRAEAVRQCLSAPMVRWLVLRRTSPEIRENMVVPMMRELPNENTGFYKMNWSDWIMTFFNWSTIRFSYCRNMKDVLNYQGLEYDFICIEELTHWNEDEWKILMWCLRTSRKGIIPNFFGSTNPWWIGHHWVKRVFVDRNFTDDEDPSQFWFVPAFVWDNKILLETQPDYVKGLQSLPEKIKKAYLEGDWNVFDGQYFPEFRTALHVISPILPEGNVRKRIICLDYWYSAPSAVYWLALMTDWRIFCYRELYITQKTYFQLALQIKAMTKASEKIDAMVVDPAIVNKPSETTWTSGADEFKRAWFKIIPADNARISGWQVMRSCLQPFEDANTGEVDCRLKITSNCSNLIRTLPMLIHDKTDVEDIDTTQEDHAADGLRYWLKFLLWNPWSLADLQQINTLMNKRVENQVQKSKTMVLKKTSTSLQKKRWLLWMQF